MALRGSSWRLYVGTAACILAAQAAVLWLVGIEVQRVRSQDQRDFLKSQSVAVAELLGAAPEWHGAAVESALARARQGGIDASLWSIDGREPLLPATVALAIDAEAMQATRRGESPVLTAAKDGHGVTYAVALAPIGKGEPRGLLRLAQPARRLAIGGATIGAVTTMAVATSLAAAGLITTSLARRWKRPLRRIIAAARRVADGNVRARVEVRGDDEFATAAYALNEMRDRLIERADASEAQRRMLASLLSQVHEGVIVVRPDGRVALMNRAAVRLLNLPMGITGDDIPCVGMAVERCIPQHDLQKMLLRGAWARLEPGDDGERVDEQRLQIETAGGVRHVLARASDFVLPDREGSTRQPGRLLVLTDITELVRSIQIKTEFVTNASHELRTPLASIRIAVETLMAMRLESEAAEAAAFLSMIDRNSSRLQALVSDLLALSRIESQAVRFRPESVEPRRELDELCGQFRPSAAARGIELLLDVDAGPRSEFLLSPHLLRLALDNLVDNALKFTERGGHVRVECRGGEREVVFRVSDDGCGIAEAEQERVFERFYQVERARSGGEERGTGLGLSIVRHAVSAMRGSVRLESGLGRGTTVTITIPQDPVVVAAAEA
ncbi:MAG: Alkaline phosphatase synthesis sensor protein PhoR [Phycisphaerae bacterium]|nr:Alkaline phosphatase synthesis sensor protein PhoR [Phycisphaerae bacterium]